MMKKLFPIISVLGSIACLAAFLSGCDDSGGSDGAEFRIQPANVNLAVDQLTVGFGAVGGHAPLTWSVSDSTLGAITGSGQAVTYTRTAKNGVNMITVTDSKQWVANAKVVQTSETNALQTLVISPSTATLDSDGDMIVFTGSGGTGPYEWSVGNGARGKVDVDGWSQSTYTRLASGDNNVILTDQHGHKAIASITQPPISPLQITPASSTVSTNAGTVVLTVSGGTGSYNWNPAPTHGTLSPLPLTSGNSKIYTSITGDAGQDIIQVTDGVSTVFSTITKN